MASLEKQIAELQEKKVVDNIQIKITKSQTFNPSGTSDAVKSTKKNGAAKAKATNATKNVGSNPATTMKPTGRSPATTAEATNTAGSTSLLHDTAGQTVALSTADELNVQKDKAKSKTLPIKQVCTHAVVSLHREDTPSYLKQYCNIDCACGKELGKCRYIGRCLLCKHYGLCNRCYDNKMAEEPRTRKRKY